MGRSPGEGKGYPLQYSGLENSRDSPWGRKESDTAEHPSCPRRLSPASASGPGAAAWLLPAASRPCFVHTALRLNLSRASARFSGRWCLHTCTLRVKGVCLHPQGISVCVPVHLREASRDGRSCVVDSPSTTATSSAARLSPEAWGTSSLPLPLFSDGVWTCLLPGPHAPRLPRRLAFPLLRGLCAHTWATFSPSVHPPIDTEDTSESWQLRLALQRP